MSSITFFPGAGGSTAAASGDRLVGDVFLQQAGLITLYGVVSGSTTNANTTPRLPEASAGYSAGGATGFQIRAVSVLKNSGVLQIRFGYADNDLGVETNTAPTTPIYIGGSTMLSEPVADSAFTFQNPFNFALDFVVPNGKYPFVIGLGATGVAQNIQIYGYEF